MRRALTALMLASLLGGCTETTLSTGGMGQVNRATEPFPTSYLTRAATALTGAPVSAGQSVAVSYPQLTIGTTAFDPQRWYVCVRGLAPKAKAPDALRIIVFGRFGTPLLVAQPAEKLLDALFRDSQQLIRLFENVIQAIGQPRTHAVVQKKNAFGAGLERVQIIVCFNRENRFRSRL